MLNDFLLNPATMIAGMTPLPFELPIISGSLRKQEFLKGRIGNSMMETKFRNKKALKDFPDWGHVNIPRSFSQTCDPHFPQRERKGQSPESSKSPAELLVGGNALASGSS